MTPVTTQGVLNESDVEQKVIYPLLAEPAYLNIPAVAIKTKSYLAPSTADKKFGIVAGYFPDYAIWLSGNPVLVVEAKHPDVASEVGFREASQYARHLNLNYPHGINPCRFIIGTNGRTLLAGYWDQDQPVITLDVEDLGVGSAAVEQLAAFCGVNILHAHIEQALSHIKIDRSIRPISLAGGQATLNSKKQLNSFAAELSPILRRYFSSRSQDNVQELAERAYVSSVEVTEYDKVLESLLKDRVTPRRDTIVETVKTTRHEERQLTPVLKNYSEGKPSGGQLQIIQGGVGVGKSLFARRYKDLLQPDDLAEKSHWAFIDFNPSPNSLEGAEKWICTSFIESFERENPLIELYDTDVQKGVFSRRIQQRRGIYESLRAVSPVEEARARADDLKTWQDDPVAFAEGVANYISGIKRENLVVVMDNVDKLDLKRQLDAFQLTLWFMERTKGFVILQMRDETYERFKNKPPLDTFRSNVAFHISPPRFIDVVKRRLELAIEYLAGEAPQTQEYTLENGVRILLPEGEVGNFLRTLYRNLFSERRNVARVLEALAGRDVRRALDIFASIIVSGHLSTDAITSNVLGAGEVSIEEYHVIRIMMRGEYRFFSDASGVISNVFHYEADWPRADNFLCIEILYLLAISRRTQGEIGIEGYFSVEHICNDIERIGYDREAVFKAINWLLRRELIIADHFNFSEVTEADTVKIQASGFIHIRILCERLEYLYGILTVTPIAEQTVSAGLADYLNRENQRGFATLRDQAKAVEVFLKYLKYEYSRLREKNPFRSVEHSGAEYIISRMENVVRRYYGQADRKAGNQSELDLI